MKSAIFAMVCLAATHARAATAYDALGAVGKQRGDKVLDRVTQVRGINGTPQPKEWVVTIVDKEARGGVREFGVQGPKLGSERAPAGREAGPVMNMNQLNVDSDGAHTIAEREAKKAGFDYDYVDYSLRAGTQGGAPIWELRMVDDQSGNSASVTIAADKGTLLDSSGFNKVARPPQQQPPPDGQVAGRVEERRGKKPQSPSNGLQRAGDSISRFVERVGRHMNRRGHQISDKFHEVFTGEERNTVPPRERRDTPPPPPRPERAPEKEKPTRDANGTEYYRPRD